MYILQNKLERKDLKMKGKISFGIVLVFVLNSCTASAISLEKFKERYDEVRKDGSFSSAADIAYAASTITLQKFKERYDEVRKDGSFSSAADIAYAAAGN
jgi:hypothetical protein